ncbi:MAG TPA: hypothetical protein VK158_02820 [Acidobacteriota bacterium]|nr:hypothetical protein [Acidobacteriota bacterium]
MAIKKAGKKKDTPKVDMYVRVINPSRSSTPPTPPRTTPAVPVKPAPKSVFPVQKPVKTVVPKQPEVFEDKDTDQTQKDQESIQTQNTSDAVTDAVNDKTVSDPNALEVIKVSTAGLAQNPTNRPTLPQTPVETIVIDPKDLSQPHPSEVKLSGYVAVLPIVFVVVALAVIFGSLAVALVGTDVIDRCRVSDNFKCTDTNVSKSAGSTISIGLEYTGKRVIIMAGEPTIQVSGSKTCTQITGYVANGMNWTNIVPLKTDEEFLLQLNCSKKPSVGEKMRFDIFTNYSDGLVTPDFHLTLAAVVKN